MCSKFCHVVMNKLGIQNCGKVLPWFCVKINLGFKNHNWYEFCHVMNKHWIPFVLSFTMLCLSMGFKLF